MNNPSAYEAAEWVSRAACGEYGAASMFPHEGDIRGIAAAKNVCHGCPVRLECLTGALNRGEQWGIWGGLTPDERKTIRRRQLRSGRSVRDLTLPDNG